MGDKQWREYKVDLSKYAGYDTTANAEVVYYNINGARVPAARLVPGIYIRCCGDKVDKVLMK
ncbi:MAG: hypothetical protein HUK02_06650 [Bacteroidaceae bacterium]|nr:hypothetical protein [Bacteroidaceae bacterium]